MKIVVDNPSCKVIVNESSVVKINTNTEPIKINVTGGRGASGTPGSYKSTSVQMINPTVGYLAITIGQINMPYSIGQRIRVVAFDDPQNYFEGYVDAYNGNNIIYLYVDIISVNHYEYNSWVINITGEPAYNQYAQITLNSGSNFDFALNTVPFPITRCDFFNENGDEVSVQYKVTDKLYIDSNIDLENHKIIIS
jgi:hypothetical protein